MIDRRIRRCLAIAFWPSIAACSAPADIDGAWALSENECRSDASFVIANGEIHGEGGARGLNRVGDAVRTDDGLIDAVEVRVDGDRMTWRDRQSGEVLTYIRCESSPASR